MIEDEHQQASVAKMLLPHITPCVTAPGFVQNARLKFQEQFKNFKDAEGLNFKEEETSTH